MQNRLRKQMNEVLLSLPKSKVTTYKALAEKLNIHPRKVAHLLKTNPDPEKIPCYKVIHHDGRIGGYVLGKDEKIRRLVRDGIAISKDQLLQTVE